MSSGEASSAGAPASPDPVTLGAAVARHLGVPVEVVGLRRRSGGASREIWAFDAVAADGTVHPLVLRRDPGSDPGQSARSTEYAVLVAAHTAGVATPTPVGVLRGDDGLGTGFLMARVDGETIPRRILRDAELAPARPRLARQAGEQAARIHAVDAGTVASLPHLGPRAQLDQYRSLLDAFGVPHPALELGLRWLDEHAPAEPDPPRLVHGDFRTGNFVVGPDGLRAVLDWELAHRGDPVEDLGWLCVRSWRFGAPGRAGGLGDVDELLAGYRDAGGDDVDAAQLRYWEAFGTLKWAVICELQAFTHLGGGRRSVELAVLGRRVCEMEWDLLELIA